MSDSCWCRVEQPKSKKEIMHIVAMRIDAFRTIGILGIITLLVCLLWSKSIIDILLQGFSRPARHKPGE